MEGRALGVVDGSFCVPLDMEFVVVFGEGGSMMTIWLVDVLSKIGSTQQGYMNLTRKKAQECERQRFKGCIDSIKNASWNTVSLSFLTASVHTGTATALAVANLLHPLK